jgi:hypothetical protein
MQKAKAKGQSESYSERLKQEAKQTKASEKGYQGYDPDVLEYIVECVTVYS